MGGLNDYGRRHSEEMFLKWPLVRHLVGGRNDLQTGILLLVGSVMGVRRQALRTVFWCSRVRFSLFSKKAPLLFFCFDTKKGRKRTQTDPWSSFKGAILVVLE